MIAFKIISVVLLLTTVALCSIWLNNIGNKWWYPPILTVIAAIGVLSSWFLGSSESFAKNAAVEVVNFLFVSQLRAWVTVGILAVSIIGSLVLVLHTWPKEKEYLAVQAYRGSPVQGTYAIGVAVIVHSVTDGMTRCTAIDKSGYAKILGIEVPTSAMIQLNETRRDGEWGWGPGLIDIEKLPKSFKYDLAKVPAEEWRKVAVPASDVGGALQPWPRDSVAPVAQRTVSMIGDKSFRNINAPWGLPDADLIIDRYSYILGLTAARTPRWIAYALSPAPLDTMREFHYDFDPAVPKEKQPSFQDYSRSGYDRGNLVSQMDVAFKGALAVREAQYMTTLTPQTPALNRGVWHKLEMATRKLAGSVGQVYVLTGPLYLYDGEPRTIGSYKVPVPTHFFRIVCWLSKGEVRTAAYLIPNRVDKLASVRGFAVPISEIEEKADLVCLPDLQLQIAKTIKKQVFQLPNL